MPFNELAMEPKVELIIGLFEIVGVQIGVRLVIFDFFVILMAICQSGANKM